MVFKPLPTVSKSAVQCINEDKWWLDDRSTGLRRFREEVETLRDPKVEPVMTTTLYHADDLLRSTSVIADVS